MTGTKRKPLSSIDYRVIEETLTALNCPRSLAILLMLRAGEYKQIVDMEFIPHHYNNLIDSRASYCATELLRKNKFLNTGIDLKQVALDGFFANEKVCQATNERLLLGNPSYSGILYAASRKIANILGEFDTDEWVSSSGWGPGVTLTLRRGNNTLFEKFHHHGEVTPTFYHLSRLLTKRASPLWEIKPKVYEGNRVVTVPKNAKTDRVIAVEPSINLFFQKGIGTMIRKRLRKWSIDLTDQTRNQSLSRLGSFDTSLATVDFSAASDTIASRLVLELLPFEWFQFLDSVRSPRGLVNDQLIEYEKFSSMGNGYTFELETLIFFAIASAVADEMGYIDPVISVYGDDVILPTKLYDRYSEVCAYFGFTVNKKKSFSTSYFRESCGAYYWNGVSIKPARLLESLTSITSKISFHNRLYEFDHQEEFSSNSFKGVRSLIRSACPGLSRVPPMLGDLSFWSKSIPRKRNYSFKVVSFEPSKVESDTNGVLLTHLYKIRVSEGVDERLKAMIHSGNHLDLRMTSVAELNGNITSIPGSGRFLRKRVRVPGGVVDF